MVKKIRINEAKNSFSNWRDELNYLLKELKYSCKLPEEGNYKNNFEISVMSRNGRFNITVKDICGVSALWENTDDIKYYMRNYTIDGMLADTLLNGILNPLRSVAWFYISTILTEIFTIACENKIDSFELNNMYRDI